MDFLTLPLARLCQWQTMWFGGDKYDWVAIKVEIPATAQASKIAKAIPETEYELIEDASHYSMFAECKPGASEIAIEESIEEPICSDGKELEESIEEPICSDGKERSRSEIHAQLIDMVAAAFDRKLNTGH